MNLMLEFKLGQGDISQIRWARRIKFDGNGGLIIFNREDALSERLLLSRLRDLRIQPLPSWTQSLAYHA
jgi:hypothetical protein